VTEFRIDATSAVDLAKAFQAAPEIVERELAAAVRRATLLLGREVRERTPVGATALLRESISARSPRLMAEGVVIGEVGTSLAHAEPVELGTKPHFPPILPLVDWVKSKLGIPADEARHVAFLISRKIGKRGTKPARMFSKALEAHRAQVELILQAGVARAVQKAFGASR
jgi:hypothetical protein